MKEDLKVNLSVLITSFIFIAIGIFLMSIGINKDELGLMFSGIALTTISFIVGSATRAYRVLKKANLRHTEEVKKSFQKNK